LGLVALVVLVVLAGTTYEWFASRADATRFPEQGHLVDIGGMRLNLDCSGASSLGMPTVILESGAGVPAYGWHLVQPEIAKFARVCSYDRAGYGWSDMPVQMPRTSLQEVHELHALLRSAAVQPPYILVGHSLGGYLIRVYNGQYSDEVVGAVFVDSSHEDQTRRMGPEFRKFFEETLKSSRSQAKLIGILIHTGAMRLIQHRQRAQMRLPLDFLQTLEYLQRRDGFMQAVGQEMESFEESANEVRNSGNFGNKPLVVLTAGKITEVPGLPKKAVDEFHETWLHDLQPQIARLSTQGRQIVVTDSTHMIPFEAPQTIVDAVRGIVQSTAHPQTK
jgi:pimeloyl-ACP methyl ester carboxylesterase